MRHKWVVLCRAVGATQLRDKKRSLKPNVNKCKIEATIAEAYILEEVSNYTTKILC